MSTVYLIGAGASNAIWELPLLGTFFRYVNWQPEDRELEQYLTTRFGTPSSQNLEEVLADIENAAYGLGAMRYGPYGKPTINALQARPGLLSLIQRTCTFPSERLSDEGFVQEYDRVLGSFHAKRGDRIITLNYDRGIEKYLHKSEKVAPADLEFKMAYLPMSPSSAIPFNGNRFGGCEIPLLKLHGSVDYFVCCNPECPSGRPLLVKGYMQTGSGCSHCGAHLQCLVVPPTLKKSFGEYPRLAFLWRLAEALLTECDRLVVWGFSCPDSDQHVRWLLRNAFRPEAGSKPPLKRVDVIDPNDDVMERLMSILGCGEELEWNRFKRHEEYRQ